MQKLLFIDQDSNSANTLGDQLNNLNCAVIYHQSIADIQKQAIDSSTIIVCDQDQAPLDNKQLLELLPLHKAIILDANPSISNAIQAIKQGAFHYLDKNDQKQLLDTVKQLLEQHQRPPTPHGMIGECAEMQQLYHYIAKTAKTDCNVLILGETGTGKELVAKAIHNSSQRKQNILTSVNCAAIPETLIESELFGYEKGAFTGAHSNRQGLIEASHNGTLFLDEIGELPLEAQARLLRFIQEGEIRRIGSVSPRKVDVRLIAATHRNLKQLCSENLFREDLFYRINVMQLNLPPLRDREDDIISIAQTLLQRSCNKFKLPHKSFSKRALTHIREYNWPGNIRELENIIERAVIISDTDQLIIDSSVLDIETHQALSSYTIENATVTSNEKPTTTQAESGQSTKNLSLEDYFLSFVLKHQDKMSETELARKLGVSRKCLWERRQRLGIPRKKTHKN